MNANLICCVFRRRTSLVLSPVRSEVTHPYRRLDEIVMTRSTSFRFSGLPATHKFGTMIALISELVNAPTSERLSRRLGIRTLRSEKD